MRTKKIVQGGATYYIGDHYEVAGGVPTLYIFAGNQRIAKITGSDKHYFHQDHLGSSTKVSDSSGAVVETAEYMPFGAMREHSGSTVSNYKYTGQELDPESGLYNYKARLYDPVLGRFITADTIVPVFSDPQALNRYAYCRNNPLVYVDPSGHDFGFSFLIGAIIGAITSGIQSDWDLEATLVGGVIGGISGGFFSEVEGGVAAALKGVVEQAAVRGAISGAAGGAAAGATAGGLGAAYYGGDIGNAMLEGAGYGAIGGAAFGGIRGYYGETWNISRVGASAVAGGGIFELSGQGFEKGVMFAGGAAFGRFLYNKLVHYDSNWNPGGSAVKKGRFDYPVEGANNIGTQGGAVDSNGLFSEGGRVSRFANQIPGVNAVSGMHDVFQVALDNWGGMATRNLLNIPGMFVAAPITYGALMMDMRAAPLYYTMSTRGRAR